jgi:hypothetical protein
MEDSIVTVVRCQCCQKSAHLTLKDNQFWCAWCQDLVQIKVEQFQNIQIDRTGKIAQLQPPISQEIPLQPLRIPSGWNLMFNNGLYEIDPLPELWTDESPWWLFKEDMLQMCHDRFNRLLDVGWHPEGDLVNGHYRLVIYIGDFRGELLYELNTRDRLKLVNAIEQMLSLISQGKS